MKAVPAVQENAIRGTEPWSWDWVEATIWTPRMLAALGNGVKGGKWYSLMDKVYAESTLKAAWARVKANKGAAGIDRVSIDRFNEQSERYLKELRQSLMAETFQPFPVKRVYIPKNDGRKRPLGIPAVKDRVVQTALKMALEPIFEHEFMPTSYGFRPGRGCKDALREVDGLIKAGYTWVVDADLSSYFDTIPHDALMQRLLEHVTDGRMLALIQQFLKQDVIDGLERWIPTAGTPQGAVLSPLLANIYLHPMDKLLAEKKLRMVRYADDFVILCQSQKEAEASLQLVREWTEANGLRLHPEKTQMGNCLEYGQGFEFLGYRFEAGRRWVRKKSQKALRDKIRQKTRRNHGDSLDEIIKSLNPMLRGWFEYFKHAYHTEYRGVDGFVRRRLRAILRTRDGKGGWGKCIQASRKWPNVFFAEAGLFTMHEAWHSARQSR